MKRCVWSPQRVKALTGIAIKQVYKLQLGYKDNTMQAKPVIASKSSVKANHCTQSQNLDAIVIQAGEICGRAIRDVKSLRPSICSGVSLKDLK